MVVAADSAVASVVAAVAVVPAVAASEVAECRIVQPT